MCGQESRETLGNTPIQDFFGGGLMGGVCIGLESDRARSRTLKKTSRRDRDRVCAKFEMPRRFRASNMNQKKKPRRARGLGSDSGLDLAISCFTNSLARKASCFTSVHTCWQRIELVSSDLDLHWYLSISTKTSRYKPFKRTAKRDQYYAKGIA